MKKQEEENVNVASHEPDTTELEEMDRIIQEDFDFDNYFWFPRGSF